MKLFVLLAIIEAVLAIQVPSDVDEAVKNIAAFDITGSVNDVVGIVGGVLNGGLAAT